MSDVNNLLLIAEKNFCSRSGQDPRARKPDRLTLPHLDHADHVNVRRDQISLDPANKTVYADGSKRLNSCEMKADGPTITNETAA